MENDRERRFLKVGTCLTHFLPRFQLRDLPRGTRILADGNSFFAERMVTLLCGCRDVEVVKLDGVKSNSMVTCRACEVIQDAFHVAAVSRRRGIPNVDMSSQRGPVVQTSADTTSIRQSERVSLEVDSVGTPQSYHRSASAQVAHSRSNKATFLMFDNDHEFQETLSEHAIEFLRGIRFEPDVLLVGHTNTNGRYSYEAKVDKYAAEYPDVPIIRYPNLVGTEGCIAEALAACTSGIREDGKAGHQCLPGPLNRVAEKDARDILKALRPRRKKQGPRSLS